MEFLLMKRMILVLDFHDCIPCLGAAHNTGLFLRYYYLLLIYIYCTGRIKQEGAPRSQAAGERSVEEIRTFRTTSATTAMTMN